MHQQSKDFRNEDQGFLKLLRSEYLLSTASSPTFNGFSKINSSSYVPHVGYFVSVFHSNMDRLSTTLTQSLIWKAIYGQTGPSQRVDYSVMEWKYRRKCLSQRHNNALSSSETEPIVDNLVLLTIELHRCYLGR